MIADRSELRGFLTIPEPALMFVTPRTQIDGTPRSF
jgi:hypothetical protein